MKRFQDVPYLGFDSEEGKIESPTFTKKEREYLALFIQCLKSEWDGSAIEKTNSFIESREMDWGLFMSLAGRLRVSAHLGNFISKEIHFPDHVRKSLKDHYFYTVVRNMVRQKGLRVILRDFNRLESQGIKVIFLKGMGLAKMLYSDPFVRISVDVDVIARRKDIPYIHEFLITHGYNYQEDRDFVSLLDQLPKGSSHLVYSRGDLWGHKRQQPQNDCFVELHYSPIGFHYRFSKDWEWLWENAKLVELNGVHVYVLNNDARFLNLCAHLLINHDFDDFLHIYELAKFIVLFGSTLNWRKIFKLAHRNEFVIPVVRVLKYLESIWSIQLPSGIKYLTHFYPPKNREKLFFRHRSLIYSLDTFLSSVSEDIEVWMKGIRRKAETYQAHYFPSNFNNRRTIDFPQSIFSGLDQLSRKINHEICKNKLDRS